MPLSIRNARAEKLAREVAALSKENLTQAIITWILHEPEAFIGKAPEGEGVVFYFEPLATQHMEASGSPSG